MRFEEPRHLTFNFANGSLPRLHTTHACPPDLANEKDCAVQAGGEGFIKELCPMCIAVAGAVTFIPRWSFFRLFLLRSLQSEGTLTVTRSSGVLSVNEVNKRFRCIFHFFHTKLFRQQRNLTSHGKTALSRYLFLLLFCFLLKRSLFVAQGSGHFSNSGEICEL